MVGIRSAGAERHVRPAVRVRGDREGRDAVVADRVGDRVRRADAGDAHARRHPGERQAAEGDTGDGADTGRVEGHGPDDAGGADRGQRAAADHGRGVQGVPEQGVPDRGECVARLRGDRAGTRRRAHPRTRARPERWRRLR